MGVHVHALVCALLCVYVCMCAHACVHVPELELNNTVRIAGASVTTTPPTAISKFDVSKSFASRISCLAPTGLTTTGKSRSTVGKSTCVTLETASATAASNTASLLVQRAEIASTSSCLLGKFFSPVTVIDTTLPALTPASKTALPLTTAVLLLLVTWHRTKLSGDFEIVSSMYDTPVSRRFSSIQYTN